MVFHSRAEPRRFSPHLRWHFVDVLLVTEMQTSTQISRLPSTDSAVDPFGMQGRSCVRRAVRELLVALVLHGGGKRLFTQMSPCHCCLLRRFQILLVL